MKLYYKVRKAIKWYQLYVPLSGNVYQGGLTYYQAKKLAKELNHTI